MLKSNNLDVATDEIKRILGNVEIFVKEDLKGTKPYRSVPMKDEEIVADYLEVSKYPEVKENLKMAYTDAWSSIEDKVSRIVGRAKNG